jgi:hypothetical protein
MTFGVAVLSILLQGPLMTAYVSRYLGAERAPPVPTGPAAS